MATLSALEKRIETNRKYVLTHKPILADIKAKIKAKQRSEFKPKNKSVCVVCGKHKTITQAHHIYPLSKQKNDVKNHNYVWLCPNHHKIVHLAIAGESFDETDVKKSKITKIAKGECNEIIKYN